jgi:hypothetical protein
LKQKGSFRQRKRIRKKFSYTTCPLSSSVTARQNGKTQTRSSGCILKKSSFSKNKSIRAETTVFISFISERNPYSREIFHSTKKIFPVPMAENAFCVPHP